VRLEHETNLQERQNRITTDFAMNTVSPLYGEVDAIDPMTGQRRTIYGGPLRRYGVPLQQSGTRKPYVFPRAGAVLKLDDKAVLRGGWGIYVAPWNYGAAGTSTWANTATRRRPTCSSPRAVCRSRH
jgi:hypothetical protein